MAMKKRALAIRLVHHQPPRQTDWPAASSARRHWHCSKPFWRKQHATEQARGSYNQLVFDHDEITTLSSLVAPSSMCVIDCLSCREELTESGRRQYSLVSGRVGSAVATCR